MSLFGENFEQSYSDGATLSNASIIDGGQIENNVDIAANFASGIAETVNVADVTNSFFDGGHNNQVVEPVSQQMLPPANQVAMANEVVTQNSQELHFSGVNNAPPAELTQKVDTVVIPVNSQSDSYKDTFYNENPFNNSAVLMTSNNNQTLNTNVSIDRGTSLEQPEKKIDNLGKIISVNDNLITVELIEDIGKLPNLIGTHVVFYYKDEFIVGEVVETDVKFIKVNIIGQIIEGRFITGLNRKPDYNSLVRPINQDEVTLMLGEQELNSTQQIRLGSSAIYNGYKINIGINDFFSNHFAIIGNTGSGKSNTLARLVQNIFTSGDYLPLNVNIFLFDAYGEYNTAFSELNKIDPILNYKTYTTNTIYPETEILKIPLWLLDVDDIALLLGANEPAQLPIIEKTLKLVPILKGVGEQVEAYKNDIITRAILDILKSGKEAAKVRDQITAVLTSFNTDFISLDAVIKQTGYDRTVRQCIYVDNNGKLQEMELLVSYLSNFLIENFILPSPKGDVQYTLQDMCDALDFALISEGILKSDKVFDYANILSVRLHALASSDSAKYFEYDKLVTRNGYISNLLTTFDGKKVQIVNFNINYVDDRLAKNITKIISKMLFGFTADNKDRGSIPIHIVIEEAHRYVQNDIDSELLGYNIFERITKEGRKYGIILGLITQRPSELSETCISQCSNFIILRTQHPKDLTYIRQMVPNFSEELTAVLKVLQPGNAIAFGSAFKVPIAVKIERPNPEPYSRNSDIARIWYAKK